MAYGSNLTDISHLQVNHFMRPETYGQWGERDRERDYYGRAAEAFRDVPNVDVLSLDETQLETLIGELETSIKEVQAIEPELGVFENIGNKMNEAAGGWVEEGDSGLEKAAKYGAMGVAAPFAALYKGGEALFNKMRSSGNAPSASSAPVRAPGATSAPMPTEAPLYNPMGSNAMRGGAVPTSYSAPNISMPDPYTEQAVFRGSAPIPMSATASKRGAPPINSGFSGGGYGNGTIGEGDGYRHPYNKWSDRTFKRYGGK